MSNFIYQKLNNISYDENDKEKSEEEIRSNFKLGMLEFYNSIC